MTTLQENEQTALVHIQPGMDDRVIALYLEGGRLKEYADALVVRNSDDVKRATDDLSTIAGIKKAIEEKRQEYLRPLLDYQKEINVAFKDFTEPLTQADTIMRQKVHDYRAEQERIRLEQERINRLREEAARAEMELKGEIAEPVGLVEVAPVAPTRYQTDVGILGTAITWRWELVDFALLPDRFKVENATLIGKVVRAGEREIPGVRIYSEETIRVTARKGN